LWGISWSYPIISPLPVQSLGIENPPALSR